MKSPSCSVARQGVLPFAVLSLILCAFSSVGAMEVTLVPKAATGWKYLANGSNQGTAWREKNFNDTNWLTGQTPLGYNDTATLNTVLAIPSNPKPITMYLRKSFTVSGTQLAQINALLLRFRKDDGAVVYLNGIELGRENMPPEPAVIAFNTTALAAAGGADETRYFEKSIGVTVTTASLEEGTNVLAMEIHQAGTGSSDSHGDAELLGFQLFPDYGRFTPNSAIAFEDAFEGVFEYEKLFEGETDIDWMCTFPNVGIAGVYNFEPNVGGGELASAQWVLFGGSSTFTSGRIDTRNYHDVKVSFEARSYLDSGAFEASDRLKMSARTSTDGADFGGEALAADLRGTASTASSEVLAGAADMKTVFVPTTNDENTASPNWHEAAFDDIGWMSGTNGTGFERSPTSSTSFSSLIGIDVLGTMFGNTASVYMRIPFASPDPATINNLQLLVKYDDGYVAYLNGTEIARKNAGNPGDPMTNLSRATGGHSDSLALQFEAVDVTAHKSLLNTGSDNILAVHGLNQSNGSSDMVVLPELHAGIPSIPPSNLNDMAGPVNGPFFTYEAVIPNGVESMEIVMNATASEFTEEIFVDNIRISGTPLSVDSYCSWVLLETALDPGEDGFPDFDADGDRISNLLEYAFVGDPEVASQTSSVSGRELLPRVVRVNNRYRMTYRQLNLTPMGTLATPFGGFTVRDLKYIPQIATTLGDWDDGASGPTEAELISISDNGDGTRDVTVEFLKNLSAVPEVYVRLKIELISD